MNNETGRAPFSTDENFLKGLAKEFRSIVTGPTDYFANLPLQGGLLEPVIFIVAVSVVSSLGILLVTMKPLQALTELIMRIGLAFVSAGYMLILGRGLGGNGTFEGTFRAVAYASAPAIVSWIPLLNLVGALYSLYMMKLGIERAHNLAPARATAVVAIWMVTMIAIAVLVAFVVAAVLFKPRETMPGL